MKPKSLKRAEAIERSLNLYKNGFVPFNIRNIIDNTFKKLSEADKYYLQNKFPGYRF